MAAIGQGGHLWNDLEIDFVYQLGVHNQKMADFAEAYKQQVLADRKHCDPEEYVYDKSILEKCFSLTAMPAIDFRTFINVLRKKRTDMKWSEKCLELEDWLKALILQSVVISIGGFALASIMYHYHFAAYFVVLAALLPIAAAGVLFSTQWRNRLPVVLNQLASFNAELDAELAVGIGERLQTSCRFPNLTFSLQQHRFLAHCNAQLRPVLDGPKVAKASKINLEISNHNTLKQELLAISENLKALTDTLNASQVESAGQTERAHDV